MADETRKVYIPEVQGGFMLPASPGAMFRVKSFTEGGTDFVNIELRNKDTGEFHPVVIPGSDPYTIEIGPISS